MYKKIFSKLSLRFFKIFMELEALSPVRHPYAISYAI